MNALFRVVDADEEQKQRGAADPPAAEDRAERRISAYDFPMFSLRSKNEGPAHR
jgi:hypothetical protein